MNRFTKASAGSPGTRRSQSSHLEGGSDQRLLRSTGKPFKRAMAAREGATEREV